MGIALKECRKYLEKRYRECLKLRTGFSETVLADTPAWLGVSLDNLGRPTKSGTNAAALVDPEIGTILYFIEYERDQDIASVVVQALSLRTRLLIGKNDGTQKDPALDRMGSWRVALYWLVPDETAFDKWQHEVAQLRANAPHTEEIPLDAVCKLKTDWPAAFEEHRFPRLLLSFRQILHIKTKREVESWSTADAQVERELTGFSSKFLEKEQRSLAVAVEEHLDALKKQRSTPPAGFRPTTFRPKSLGARNFRNLRETILELGAEEVACAVVSGPNGSGKSALFEAMSLAIFRTSGRYLEFLRDPDITSRQPAADYKARYIANLSRKWGPPQLLIDGQPEEIRLPATKEEAVSSERLSEGSFLSQERSSQFCRRNAADLGADVLSGYSDLANGVQWFVEDAYSRANAARQDLLRGLGLSANITKLETAHQRVAEKRLSEAIEFAPTTLVGWLKALSEDFGDFVPAARSALRAWERWNAIERRSEVAAESVVLLELSVAQKTIGQWLSDYNQCVRETKRLFGEPVGPLLAAMRNSTTIADRLRLWGAWLEASDVRAPASTDTSLIEATKKELEEQTKRQAQIAKSGALLRTRLDHLTSITTTVANRWGEENDDRCVTCDSDLRSRGGFAKVVKAVFERTTQDRAALEAEYRLASAKLRTLNERLSQLGAATSPVTADEQDELVQLFGPFMPDGLSVQAFLKTSTGRDRLVAFALHLRSCPSLPEEVDVGQRSEDVAKLIIDQCLRVAGTFNGPNNWAAVRKRLSDQLGDVVKSHLPKTLEALWLELVLNLTAAPWLLRQRPSFNVRTKRNEQTLAIRIGSEEDGPLARHIFNQAELNVLGLAWFFVRYATFGRFVAPIMVLDDPAQQMDQTTYRDLCRLLETIVRLHRVERLPLHLVVMFHQEDRALDAARALKAPLHIFAWSASQTAHSVNRVDVFGDTTPLAPSAVFA